MSELGNAKSNATNENSCTSNFQCCPDGLVGCQQVCFNGTCQTTALPEKDMTLIIIGGLVLLALVLGIIIFVAHIYSDPKNFKK